MQENFIGVLLYMRCGIHFININVMIVVTNKYLLPCRIILFRRNNNDKIEWKLENHQARILVVSNNYLQA